VLSVRASSSEVMVVFGLGKVGILWAQRRPQCVAMAMADMDFVDTERRSPKVCSLVVAR
jgi:hypothetical protein